MAKIFLELIEQGKYTLEEVPTIWRKQVEELMNDKEEK